MWARGLLGATFPLCDTGGQAGGPLGPARLVARGVTGPGRRGSRGSSGPLRVASRSGSTGSRCAERVQAEWRGSVLALLACRARGEEGSVGARGPCPPTGFLAPRLSARLAAAPWPPAALSPQTRSRPPSRPPPETRALKPGARGCWVLEEELGDCSGGPVAPPAWTRSAVPAARPRPRVHTPRHPQPWTVLFPWSAARRAVCIGPDRSPGASSRRSPLRGGRGSLGALPKGRPASWEAQAPQQKAGLWPALPGCRQGGGAGPLEPGFERMLGP